MAPEMALVLVLAKVPERGMALGKALVPEKAQGWMAT